MTTHYLARLNPPPSIPPRDPLYITSTGLTPDPAKAARFASLDQAYSAARAAIHGRPDPFWPQEHRANARLRALMTGWRPVVMEDYL